MHDLLLAHQVTFPRAPCARYADTRPRPRAPKEETQSHAHAPRVADDVDSANGSGVTGTPTFFVNYRRHEGAYDIQTLAAAVRAARARSALASVIGALAGVWSARRAVTRRRGGAGEARATSMSA